MSKILAINCSDNGSSGGIVTSILNEANASGWTTFIACPNPKTQTNQAFKISSSKIRRLFNHFISRLFGIDGFCANKDTKNLIKFIEKENPDIIHLHTLHDYFINIEILFDYLKTKNIAIVWTFHDCWPFTGKCPNFLHNNCNKWTKQCDACIAKREYPKSILCNNQSQLFEKKRIIFLENKMHIVCPSKWMSDCISLSIAKNQQQSIIYNGINQRFFDEKNSPTPSLLTLNAYTNKKIIFSMAFPWSKYKKIDTIVSLSERMSDKEKYLFVVAGASSATKVISSNLIYLPRLDIADIISWLDHSTVFLNPSIEESFGLTNVEAQARGLPAIIIKNSGGSEETIIRGKTGFVVDSNDLEEMERLILQIDEYGRTFFAANCKSNAARFNEKNMTTSYLELYNRILKNHNFD